MEIRNRKISGQELPPTDTAKSTRGHLIQGRGRSGRNDAFAAELPDKLPPTGTAKEY
jgi:hypothetical protein